MTQAAFFTGIDTSAIDGLNFGKLVWLAVGGLVVWAFKKDWIGIATFGPYDRGFREFFGRPGHLLRQGPHLHIIGLGNLRKASVASSIVSLTNRVNVNGRVYIYILEVITSVEDKKDRIFAAIYETFDEGKKDSYNAQRIAYVKNSIEQAVRDIIESTGDDRAVTTERINDHCRDNLLLKCGTQIERVMMTEFTPVDAQIIKDGMPEPGPEGSDRTVVVPIQTHQQTA